MTAFPKNWRNYAKLGIISPILRESHVAPRLFFIPISEDHKSALRVVMMPPFRQRDQGLKARIAGNDDVAFGEPEGMPIAREFFEDRRHVRLRRWRRRRGGFGPRIRC